MAIISKVITQQRDTWDKLSFRLYNNEYFINQLVEANPGWINVTEFDAGVALNVPKALVPTTISSVVWGGVIRYS